MTAFVDTNVLVRQLTGSPADTAAAAARLLASGETLLLPDLILAETIYVLQSVYGMERTRVAQLAQGVLATGSVRVTDPALLARSIEVYEAHRLSFADAYLVASAEATGIGRIASFDRGIDRVRTVERIEP
ncbi:PIN domain-containing protein [Candidatus Poriferisodalis sp.]|uniref:PIN domain-containing protein n=1 Tax=Candidatus Poriferisodalis sp. TaxID=3101277 RepID=UPI003B5269A8